MQTRTLTLVRQPMTDGATLGALSEEGAEICKTLELEYWNNAASVSCIPVSPEGGYLCKLINSPRFGLTYEVSGVEGRSHILFHSGNIEKDTHGCILVGVVHAPSRNGLGWNAKPDTVLHSKTAMRRFMEHMHGADEFKLVITEEHPINEPV